MHAVVLGMYVTHAVIGAFVAVLATFSMVEAIRKRALPVVVIAMVGLGLGAELLHSSVVRDVQIKVLLLDDSARGREVYDASPGRIFAADQSVFDDLRRGDIVRCQVTRSLVLTPMLVSCEH